MADSINFFVSDTHLLWRLIPITNWQVETSVSCKNRARFAISSQASGSAFGIVLKRSVTIQNIPPSFAKAKPQALSSVILRAVLPPRFSIVR